MCGICGKAVQTELRKDFLSIINRMMRAMNYRGPDDEGTYISKQAALGHRRLSIIDLHTGKQPISNEDQSIWVVFNGEIYNYRELRAELAKHGHVFRTNTDTEVLVHAYEEYGEKLLQKLRGMFAFAIWDEKNHILLLARDRVGIKPLYYSHTEDNLIFASEIKSLLEDPSIKQDIDINLIDRFLTYLYMPGSDTLFKHIKKLLPGYYLIWQGGNVSVNKYWDLNFSEEKNSKSFYESKKQLDDLLKESVRLHMISDVPIGILLSGGVDSTALLSYAISETDKPVSTFTVGFENEAFADEREYANIAAKQFGTKHYDMSISVKDFSDFLPNYVWHMEEPVCEPPAIALYYVSRLASEHVKVLISGEGGDEAFAGYPNYRNYLWLERIKKFLGPLSPLSSSLIKSLPSVAGVKRIQRYASLMTLPFDRYYYSRTSHPFSFFNLNGTELYTQDFSSIVNKSYSVIPTAGLLREMNSSDVLDRMLYIDAKSWLPDDLLIKADKMTMATSVELRVPLLDHKVLEFAANLPSHFKVNGLTTKHILKEALNARVPPAIIKRKKTGFPIPYGIWLRNEMRSFINEILLDEKTMSRGFFQRSSVERLIKYNSKKSDYSKEIFSLLILELWLRIFADHDTSLVNTSFLV